MLVTLDKTKESLGITTADYDSFLNSQIAFVSEVVEAYCARKFQQANYVETFYKDEWLKENNEINKRLKLYCFPVISVTEVREFEDSNDLVGEVITTFRLNPQSGFLTRTDQDSWYYGSNSFYSGNDIIRVTYVGGYATVPEIIQQTVISIVGERYNKKKNGIDLNFGSDIQRLSIPGAISIDFDYSLQNNDRKTAFGTILGNHVNVLDYYRSERTLVHSSRLDYYSVS
jgi:hypothetical protein